MRVLLLFLPAVLMLAGCNQKSAQQSAEGRAVHTRELPPPPRPNSEVGRYTIIHSPHIEKDTMLLDTVTGQTWRLVVVTDSVGDPNAWEPVYRLDTLADYAKLPPPKKK